MPMCTQPPSVEVIVAGTGHRPPKLGGYDVKTFKRLVKLAKSWLSEREVTKVISGLALGWDQALAEAALQLNIPLVAAVPFEGQELQWPVESQQRYITLLRQAGEKIVVSEGGYHPAKMHLRNEWMVDHCDVVLALYNGEKMGGTHSCVKYARKCGKTIINLWDEWEALHG